MNKHKIIIEMDGQTIVYEGFISQTSVRHNYEYHTEIVGWPKPIHYPCPLTVNLTMEHAEQTK